MIVKNGHSVKNENWNSVTCDSILTVWVEIMQWVLGMSNNMLLASCTHKIQLTTSHTSRETDNNHSIWLEKCSGGGEKSWCIVLRSVSSVWPHWRGPTDGEARHLWSGCNNNNMDQVLPWGTVSGRLLWKCLVGSREDPGGKSAREQAFSPSPKCSPTQWESGSPRPSLLPIQMTQLSTSGGGQGGSQGRVGDGCKGGSGVHEGDTARSKCRKNWLPHVWLKRGRANSSRGHYDQGVDWGEDAGRDNHQGLRLEDTLQKTSVGTAKQNSSDKKAKT
jgi:hypothetical protein